jgi:heat shock protein HtpX
MNNQQSYQQRSAMDWRKQIRLNQRRTYYVIAFFLLTYLAVGLLIDLFILTYGSHGLTASGYANVDGGTTLFLINALKYLITFQITPYATLIMLAVAVISILVTYSCHNRIMLMGTQARQITAESSRTAEEKQLYNIVEELKIAAGLNYMPRIYIIEADYMNAFASGFSEKSAMIAITRGLLEKLDREETQAVMAHELSHIRHLDIKLTLTVSVLSSLMLIALDVLFYSAFFARPQGRSTGKRGAANALFLIILIARFVLPLLNMIAMLYLSRKREFMADAGAVELMRDNKPMARALMKIANDHKNNKQSYRKAYRNTAHEEVRQAAYIFDPTSLGFNAGSSMLDAFSTHPSIQRRLEALGFKKQKAKKTEDTVTKQ